MKRRNIKEKHDREKWFYIQVLELSDSISDYIRIFQKLNGLAQFQRKV